MTWDQFNSLHTVDVHICSRNCTIGRHRS